MYDCLLAEPIWMIVCQQTPHIYARYEQQPLPHTKENIYDCLVTEPISVIVCQHTPHIYASYEQHSCLHTKEYIYNCLLTDTTYISEPILYGVGTISRLLKIIGLFRSFAKEPYEKDYILQMRPLKFKEPTNCSHPISESISMQNHLHHIQ